MTTVSEAILSRRSIRAFLDKPVATDLITKIITQSARAPSGGNLQPWYIDVVTGDSHKKLLDLIDKKIADNPTGESEITISTLETCRINLPTADGQPALAFMMQWVLHMMISKRVGMP